MFANLASIIFVRIWSTGLIVARASVPYASIELFLTIRLVLSAALLAALATRQTVLNAARRRRTAEWRVFVCARLDCRARDAHGHYVPDRKHETPCRRDRRLRTVW
jgi:drug/metabolite transporter (DMT)-like permease